MNQMFEKDIVLDFLVSSCYTANKIEYHSFVG